MLFFQLLTLISVKSAELFNGSLDGYLSLNETYTLIRKYSETHSNLELLTVGKTHSNLDILALRLVNPRSPRILIVGGHHARELISMTQVFYLLEHILNSNLNTREIIFIPVLNVEGLAAISSNFEENKKILEIRKNMRPSTCNNILDIGVDLNRNYGFKWAFDETGSSKSPCSEEYRGESAFSEAETQAIKNLLEIYQFDSVISYHSYGDMYIRPTGYEKKVMSDFPVSHQNLYHDLKQSLQKDFRFGSVQELLNYNANGSLMDYVFSLGIFIIEIEIGPERFNSFHPNKEKIEDILKSHLKPFEVIYNRTTSDLVARASNKGRNVLVQVENRGLAMEYKKEIVIRVGNSSFEYKMVSPHHARTVGNAVYVEIPNLRNEQKVMIEIIVFSRNDQDVVSGYFWPSGEIETGFNEVFEFKVDRPGIAVQVLVVVVLTAVVLVFLGIVYFCVASRKNELEFVEMVEIVPSIPF